MASAWRAPRCLSASLCSLHRLYSSSSASSTTDQFIDYARRSCKGKQDQALDILRSGLSVTAHPSLESARLHLAAAEVLLDASQLADVQAHTSRARDALSQAGPQQQALQLQCGMLSVRAFLTQGLDDEACQAAVAVEATQGLAASSHAQGQGLLLLPALTPRGHEALRDQAHAAATALSAGGASSSGGTPSGDAASPLLHLGTWLLSQGNAAAADERFKAAASAAAAAKPTAAAQPAPIVSEAQWSELEAAATLGSAQVAVSAEKWDQAEELLGRSLKAAESVSTEQHPRVTAALLLLGKVYARTARIMFAEGLYREAAKLMHLDPSKPQALPSPSVVHPSLAAMLAWQHHQLLTTLPNRGGEASTWGACARDLWSRSGLPAAGQDIEAVLGSPEYLRGKGHAGSGLVLSLLTRRAFGMRPPNS